MSIKLNRLLPTLIISLDCAFVGVDCYAALSFFKHLIKQPSKMESLFSHQFSFSFVAIDLLLWDDVKLDEKVTD